MSQTNLNERGEFIISNGREEKTNPPFTTLQMKNNAIKAYGIGNVAYYPINDVLVLGGNSLVKVVFSVTNIDDASKMSISQPMAWNQKLQTTMEQAGNGDPYYFVLEKQFLNRTIQSEWDPNGLVSLKYDGHTPTHISVTIGKEYAMDGEWFVLLISACYNDGNNYVNIEDHNGKGGEPPGVGAKVPSH